MPDPPAVDDDPVLTVHHAAQYLLNSSTDQVSATLAQAALRARESLTEDEATRPVRELGPGAGREIIDIIEMLDNCVLLLQAKTMPRHTHAQYEQVSITPNQIVLFKLRYKCSN